MDRVSREPRSFSQFVSGRGYPTGKLEQDLDRLAARKFAEAQAKAATERAKTSPLSIRTTPLVRDTYEPSGQRPHVS